VSVSNSWLRGDRTLDEIAAMHYPAHMVQVGQRCHLPIAETKGRLAVQRCVIRPASEMTVLPSRALDCGSIGNRHRRRGTTWTWFAAAVLIVHGAVHPLGLAAYLQLAVVNGLPYKTSLLAGHWRVGAVGMLVFGALWSVPAVGFPAAAMGMLTRRGWWPRLLVRSAVASLAPTALDIDVVIAGVAVNVAILMALRFRSRGAGAQDRRKST
jgi:hypothetical protein